MVCSVSFALIQFVQVLSEHIQHKIKVPVQTDLAGRSASGRKSWCIASLVWKSFAGWPLAAK